MNSNLSLTTFIVLLLMWCLTACHNDYNNALKKKIVECSSSDKVIDENDYQMLKGFVVSHIDYKDFNEFSKNDTLFVRKIKSLLSDTSIVIKSPIEKRAKLGSIQFYIETSGSMGGYMNGKTKFQDITADLVGKLATTYHSIRFIPNTVVDSVKPYSDVKVYINDLSKSKFKIQGHSPLHTIFEVISTRAEQGDVSFFVTDGIMSGSDLEIKGNPQFNLQQSNTLKNYVRLIFDGLKEKFRGNYAVSVFAFKSNFICGSKYYYFTYKNDKIRKDFPDRPFYIFVFGQGDLVKEVLQKLKGDDAFLPLEELHFGAGTMITNVGIPFKSHLSASDKNACMIERDESIKCKGTPSLTHPVKFAIGFNLETLPKYAAEISYLNANIQVKGSNRIVIKNSEVKLISQSLKQQLDSRKERPKVLANGCTHYIEVEVDDMFANQDTIHVKLLKKDNPWFSNWSTDNDQTIASDKLIQVQTFNFSYLINGFRDTFKNDFNGCYFSINVIVKNSK